MSAVPLPAIVAFLCRSHLIKSYLNELNPSPVRGFRAFFTVERQLYQWLTYST